ncbi:MAG TPA: hypothetical protein VJK04_02625 [Candidatus Paceibacterota bacterium]
MPWHWLKGENWFFIGGLVLIALHVIGVALIAQDMKHTKVGEKDGNPDN